MKKIRKFLLSFIVGILVVSFFCISTSAAEITREIKDEIARNNEFPLDIIVSSVSEDNKEVTIGVREKDAFSLYDNISFRISEFQSDEVIYSNLFHAADTVSVSGIFTAEMYCIYLMIYTGSGNREYEAILSFEKDDVVELKLSYNELINDVTDETKKQQEEKNAEEIEGLYESMFADLDIPPFINEDTARRAGHILPLEEYDNNKNVIGYQNSDGTKTVYLFPSPVKYEDAEGKLHNAVPKIVEAEETAKKNGYAFMNDYGKIKTYYSDSLSNTRSVMVKSDDIEFEFGFSMPEGDNSIFKSIITAISDFFDGASNKAEVSKYKKQQVVQYNKIDDNDTQIIAEPTINGAKQTLILNSVPESNIISFWVENGSFKAIQNESGTSVEFYNENGIAYSIGDVEIRDSFDGENTNGALHVSANNTLKVLESTNGRALIEVSLDENLINSPITVYPVSVLLYATISDTVLNGDRFEDRTVFSYGPSLGANSNKLIVGYNGTYSGTECYNYYNGTTCQCGYTYTYPIEGVTFMKCDFSNLSIDPTNIQSANLLLHEMFASYSSVPINLKRVTSNWTENSVTSDYIYDVDDGYVGNSSLDVGGWSPPHERSFDITRMTIDHLINVNNGSGGIENYGFQLRSSVYAPQKCFYSSECGDTANQPKLVITYREPQTPSDLGLSTEKIYKIKNLSTNKYLTIEGGKQIDGAIAKQRTSTYELEMYWKIEYLSDSDAYRFIPMHAQNMRLDVISSANANSAVVGIRNSNGGYQSSKWKIVKNETDNYSILASCSYGTKGLKASGNNNVVIFDSTNDHHWKFEEATCNGVSSVGVDSHVFELIEAPTSAHYECIVCGKDVNIPEYDDISILNDEDYMTVFALQQMYYYELSKGDYLKAEGCLRAIDGIRKQSRYYSNSISLYQYRDSLGNYKSPNSYEYTIIQNGLQFAPVCIEITVNRITIAGFLLDSLVTSLLKNTVGIILAPFDDISSIYNDVVLMADIVDYIGDKDEYALAEVRGSVINWVAGRLNGVIKNAPGKISKAAGKLSIAMLVVGILYDAYFIARGSTRLPGNYAIDVNVYTTSGYDQFIGDYGYKYTNGSSAVNKNHKNIINEYFEPWNNEVFEPTILPAYGYCDISYMGVKDANGNDKPNLTLIL